MSSKKTLYQVLDVPANVSAEAIPAAHREKLAQLQASEASLSAEDFDYRLKLLNMALETLSDPLSRRAYDEQLMARLPPSAARRATMAMVPVADTADVARRADALALKADALALRAEAMSMRSGLTAYQASEVPDSAAGQLLSMVKGPLVRIGVVLGTLAAIAMVAQMTFMFVAVRKHDNAAEAQQAARDRIVIEEYYQTYGVRPASAAEARRLEDERRRHDAEQRAEEYARQQAERQERQFLDESRRTAERVSSEMRRAEEQARREEEWKRVEREREEARRQSEEQRRVYQAQQKWRNAASHLE